METAIDFKKYQKCIEEPLFKKMGKVVNVIGLTIESAGPDARLGDICRIFPAGGEGVSIMAEVVGFKGGMTQLMPYEVTDGIGSGSIVENTNSPLMVDITDDILGRTLDGLGRPVDGGTFETTARYPVEAAPPDPLEREIIDEVLPLGVKAVDGLLTVGKGR